MKQLKVIWRGLTPLIMHSCQGVNPLHPLTKEMKKITGKKKKTDEDYIAMSDIEFEQGIYWDNAIGLCVPTNNIEATIRNAAKNFKKGTAVEKFVSCKDINVAVDIGEKKTLAELKADLKYRDVRPMTVNRQKINRTRPRFDRWSIEFTLLYEEKQMDFSDLVQILEFAGKYVGFCDSRPKYGQFACVVEELD